MYITTDEQRKILDYINKGYNVELNSKVGTGKSTLGLIIAQSNSEKSILFLTYSQKLAVEYKILAEKENLNNIEVKSFNTFFQNSYSTDKDIKTDLDLIHLIENNTTLLDELPNYDIIIIDEAQDLDFSIYKCLTKVLAKTYKNSQLVVMGDADQNIYRFKGSDTRFLDNAQAVFKFNDREWKKAHLSKSLRLTKDITDFLNKIYYQKDYIESDISINNSFNYIVCDSADVYDLYKKLEPIFDKYKDEEIIIVTYAYRYYEQSHFSNFLNFLSSQDHLIYKQNHLDHEVSVSDYKNKIVATSVLASKGFERKVAILFDYDNEYLDYVMQDVHNKKPTNFHMVGLTRGKEKTIILNDYLSSPLRFLNKENLLKCVSTTLEDDKFNEWKEILDEPDYKYQEALKGKKYKYSVKTLLRSVLITNLKNELQGLRFYEKDLVSNYDFNEVISNISYYKQEKDNQILYTENVNILNALFFKMYYQYKKNKLDDFISKIESIFELINVENYKGELSYLLPYKERIKKFIDNYKNNDFNLMELVLIVYVFKEHKFFKLNQIQKNSWITDEQKVAAFKLYESILSDDTTFELNLELKTESIELYGVASCFDHKTKTIWDFKFTDEVSLASMLQLLVYKYIILKNENFEEYKDYQLKIFNLKKCKEMTFYLDDESIIRLVEKIISIKLENKKEIGEEQFLQKCLDWILKQ
ncbi:hypothetical protein SHELI_v1c06540 [Spiroplasma helicoides]|uniref:UvrD-like helicase ATP-binding domain-containing protein n=1 Tax=Spiroplasma helicoides TaxID=216938 RepID=A0A1B3SL00_9MOLU|nr:UvrD-helicase domain-containing protein [Spiroplasma helicoides]AOG60605.1 hypothetical protein SHELI_v1c06540 [Spiroplasma helicoides]